MEPLEERMKIIEYHQRLLLEMIQHHKYPVFELIIRNGLSEGEVQEFFELCEILQKKYEEQRKAGFLTFTPLLTHFVGMLNMKLNPEETIEALYNQDMYYPLMKKLNEIIKEDVQKVW